MKRFHRLSGIVLAIRALALAHRSQSAELLTFAFDAQIETIFDTTPFASGINVETGDTITGRFTFEPIAASGQQSLTTVQLTPAQLLIDGVSFITPSVLSDFTLRSVNKGGVADAPFSVADSISAGSTITPSNADDFPNLSLDRSSFRISLLGEDEILNGASFPADSKVWNAFKFNRQILVNLRGRGGETLAFQGTLGDFSLVPEPVSGLIAILLLSGVALANATNRLY